MEAPAGIRFGSYELIRRLAHGGMAEVYLARQRGPQGFDRRVAIKRILPHLADSEDFLRMFLEEARLAASLNHPNIVHLYELGKLAEDYFLAMEYIDGVHAGEIVDRGPQKRMPPALVARIGADACAGLNYVHHAVDAEGRPLHLVHRDISPPNLMLSYDGVVKLMDFGIAKAAGQMDLTRPGVVKGKFAYMSPEQTVGQKLDGRSDVFSLSLILWELLAGEVALSRKDPVMAMVMIRDGKLRSIRSVRPDVPPALAAVLERGLQVDREQRPTAAELGNALEGFIKSSPELGTPLQLSTWLREQFPRRHPTDVNQQDLADLNASDWVVATRDKGKSLGPPTTLVLSAVDAMGVPVTETAGAAAGPAPGLDTDDDQPTALTGAAPVGLMRPVQRTPMPMPEPMSRPVLAEAAAPAARGRRALRIAAAAVGGLLAIVLLVLVLGPEPSTPQGRQAGTDTTKADAAVEASTDDAPDPALGPALPGRLIVVTAPPGARVSLEGGPPLSAPARFVDLAPGTYTVTIRKAGYQTETRSVEVVPGQARDVVVQMQPDE